MILECLSEWSDISVFTMHSLSPSSFFLEKNMQQFFLKILSQKCGRFSPHPVCLQLLQTLSILFENIRNETSICELLSTGILSCTVPLIIIYCVVCRLPSLQQSCELTDCAEAGLFR